MILLPKYHQTCWKSLKSLLALCKPVNYFKSFKFNCNLNKSLKIWIQFNFGFGPGLRARNAHWSRSCDRQSHEIETINLNRSIYFQHIRTRFVKPINYRCQFHQHFTRSFCASRSQKHKKILTNWLNSYAFGSYLCKSCA